MSVRSVIFLLVGLIVMSSCSKKRGATSSKPKKRSISYLMDRVEDREIHPEWFAAKMKVRAAENYFKVKTMQLNVRNQHDRVIWVSAVVQIGIKMEVARALITPDSIKVMDKFNKQYFAEPFDYYQKYFDYPLSFEVLQDVFLGNVPDPDQYQTVSNLVGEYLLESRTEQLSLDPSDYSIKSIEKTYGDRNALRIEHLAYEKQEGKQFPVERKYTLVTPENYIFNCEFSSIVFNEPQKFPFKISSQYQRIR